MHTIEIPRQRWTADVTSFGEKHRRAAVSLEVTGSDIGAQPEAHALPLEGISVEHAGRGDTISIFLERSLDDHLTHVIERPAHVRVEQSDAGDDLAMQFEEDDGTVTIMTLDRS